MTGGQQMWRRNMDATRCHVLLYTDKAKREATEQDIAS
jgi:hypothetical protein